MPQSEQPRTPTARRGTAAPRAVVAALGLAALAATGCRGPFGGSVLRVDNHATAPVRVDAWVAPPAVAAAVEAPHNVTVEPGERARMVLQNPPGVKDPSVTIRVQPTEGSELRGIAGKPLWLELAPPDPFRVEVTGEPGDLKVRRE